MDNFYINFYKCDNKAYVGQWKDNEIDSNTEKNLWETNKGLIWLDIGIVSQKTIKQIAINNNCNIDSVLHNICHTKGIKPDIN